MEKYKLVVYLEVEDRDVALGLAKDMESDIGCTDGVDRDSVTVVVEKIWDVNK